MHPVERHPREPTTPSLEYGGWIWRYDLEPVGDDQTNVTLTYDWSAVPPEGREIIQFPLFDSDRTWTTR